MVPPLPAPPPTMRFVVLVLLFWGVGTGMEEDDTPLTRRCFFVVEENALGILVCLVPVIVVVVEAKGVVGGFFDFVGVKAVGVLHSRSDRFSFRCKRSKTELSPIEVVDDNAD